MVHLSHCTGSFPILDMSWWRVCQVEGGVETEYQSRAEDGDGQRQQLLPGVGDGPGGGACNVSCTVLYCRWRRLGSLTPPMTTSTAASSGSAARIGQSPPARRRASRRWKIFLSSDKKYLTRYHGPGEPAESGHCGQDRVELPAVDHAQVHVAARVAAAGARRVRARPAGQRRGARIRRHPRAPRTRHSLRQVG